MKRWDSNDGEKVDKINGSKSAVDKKKKKKNLQRLGGTGLSLEAFANAKTMSNKYNPAFKKKQREFYKNAKYVSKYKKSLKQQTQQNDASSAVRPMEDQNQNGDVNKMKIKDKKKKLKMEELYERKREDEEKARLEREATIQAKKEERERAEAQRKATRAKMFKKTRYGQPVMKYRIEHLLQTIQGSSQNSVKNNT